MNILSVNSLERSYDLPSVQHPAERPLIGKHFKRFLLISYVFSLAFLVLTVVSDFNKPQANQSNDRQHRLQ